MSSNGTCLNWSEIDVVPVTATDRNPRLPSSGRYLQVPTNQSRFRVSAT